MIRKYSRKIAAGLVLGGAVLVAGQVHGATVTLGPEDIGGLHFAFGVTTGGSIDSPNDALDTTLGLFNPALGTLTGVEFDYTYSFKLLLTDPASASFTGGSFSGGGALALENVVNSSTTESLSNSTSASIVNTVSNSTEIDGIVSGSVNAPADAGFFEPPVFGNAYNFIFTPDITYAFTASGSPTVDVDLVDNSNTDTGGSVSVTYTYTPTATSATPLPRAAAGGLALLSLAGIGGLIRRRKMA